jgi:hypothetical protein
MADTYDILAGDGSVLQYRPDQFSEFTEARSRAQHDELVADGWLALDQRIEAGEMPVHPSALEEALTEHVVPPEQAPQITVFILGRLKPGEEGFKVV